MTKCRGGLSAGFGELAVIRLVWDISQRGLASSFKR